ncbi:MAG: orotidine-5'-phosphate decarboxylase [Proteobacteria bacterium]|nr:orotidine-5'-phosphate decarboxylase [Pseudomonadota bacterium]
MTLSKSIVALDHSNESQALQFLEKLDPKLCQIKIGSILFTHYGPNLLEKIRAKGFKIFLDLKYHDIPQTVAGACTAAAALGIWMVNIHVSGGMAMMQAAKQAVQALPIAQRPLLIGVTILTSLDDVDLTAIGFAKDAGSMVVHFAKMAHQAGLDGVVCSPQEIILLRQNLPKNFILVTPGIRFQDNAAQDQKRIMTPKEALLLGADYLVLGRAISQADDPIQVLTAINDNSFF